MPSIEPYRDPKLPERFQRWIETLRLTLRPVPLFLEGDGSPEGVVFASKNTRYFNRTGALGTVLYVKNTAASVNTGWLPYAGGAGGAGGVDVQVFDTAGTYTAGVNGWEKPAAATANSPVDVYMTGGGAGGGSGRRGATLTNRGGGGGGEGAGRSFVHLIAGTLPATVTVIVGAGGAGGASRVTDNTNGLNGVDGGDSSFGTYVLAFGGDHGNLGTTATASGGAGLGAGEIYYSGHQNADGLNGGDGRPTSGTAAENPVTSSWAVQCGGGGGGGGIDLNNNKLDGGRGSALGRFISWTPDNGGTSPDGNGGTGGNFRGNMGVGIGGGGGAGVGGIGGNGGFPGGSGGGGGAGVNVGDPFDAPSGKGGDGSDGIVVVITHL